MSTIAAAWANPESGEGTLQYAEGYAGYVAQSWRRDGEVLIDIDASAVVSIDGARAMIAAIEAAIAEAVA